VLLEVDAVSVGAVIAFWGVSFLLVLTPGADWAYMIDAGLRGRSVGPPVSGLLIGYLVLTAVVAAGVAALVAGTPVALTMLTAVGACYLVWLGLAGLARPAGPVAAGGDFESRSWWRQTAKGAGISTLNPKGLLLFLALLPQFTDATANVPLAGQIIVLGIVHTTSCAVVYTGVGVGARVVLAARPAWARIVSRCSGVAMLAIGVGLLVEQVVV
jgi:threonine/homoserine/homoserine lactone efflux protein